MSTLSKDLLVAHNLKVAMSLADRVYLMGKAHLGLSGTRDELDARPDIRARYLAIWKTLNFAISTTSRRLKTLRLKTG